jgi:hypothetical protein
MGRPPPWLMWGSGQPMTVLTDLGNNPSSQQLVQVIYGRPETWRFYFEAKITRVAGTIDPLTRLRVAFHVTFGVGRATTRFENFCFIDWGAGPLLIVPNSVRRCTSVEVAKENTTRVSNNVIESVVAQNIQVEAVGSFVEAGAGVEADVQLVNFWAPEVHIRPEWHLKPPHFPGEEHKGH